MTNITNSEQVQNHYDVIPYESYPFSYTSPEHLATLGILFGMKPPKIETARVLELGCASGGNLIPHATLYPKGHYVGVDLSKVQIDEGLSHIKAIGLKNIELKHCSISDLDESLGKFDYIICHGVFSWVAKPIQDKILEIADKHLTENGIAYISYNTLPGWNNVRTIRDMVLYHANGFSNELDKISQAKAMLLFIKDSLEDQDTPYAKILSNEIDIISNEKDSYLTHEHLEENNKQFYFSEFIKEAADHNLQYLSDTSLASMYIGNIKKSAHDKLQAINDIIRTEQYLDFINNRRFRTTLLCHNNVSINRSLNLDQIKDFAMSLDIVPEKPFNQKDLESDTVQVNFFFKGDAKNTISSPSPYLKAILYVLAENNSYPLKFDTVVKKANSLFKKDYRTQIAADLLNNAMNLVIKGFMQISLIEIDKTKLDIEKPSLNNLALYQINNTESNWITTLRHSAFGVNIFDKFALKYMDGNHTKAQIVDILIKEVKNDKLFLSIKDVKIVEEDQIKEHITGHLENTIARLYAQAGILK